MGEMWDVGFANMLKERDNKIPIGNVEGEVVSIKPLKISILSGSAILDKSHLYITHSLLDREYDIDISGTGSMGEVVSVGGTLMSLNLTKDAHGGKTKLYFKLEVGDKVLLVPSSDEQSFFIVDIVEKVVD